MADDIPQNAKLVFKGILFDVYHWEQKRFDGTYATYEKLRRKPSVTILPVTADGKFMLCEEEQPSRGKFLSVPGGQIDKRETSKQAAQRELLEETGHEGEEWTLWQKTHPYGNKIEWTVYNYIARGCRKVAEPRLDAGERIKPFFVDFEKFLDIVLTEPSFRNVEVTLAAVNAIRKPGGIQALRTLLITNSCSRVQKDYN